MSSHESDEALFIAFFVLQMIGWMGALLLLLTSIVSTNVQRHVTWQSLCFSWFISSFSYSFLLITGQLGKDNPNPGVCLAQASAMYAVPALMGGTTLALAFHLFLQCRSPATVLDYEMNSSSLVRKVVMVVLPYIFPLGLFIGFCVYGSKNPSKVLLAGSTMYCRLGLSLPGRITAIYVAIITIPTVVLEVLIIHTLFRHWHVFSTSRLATVVRLGAFTFVGIFSVIVSLVCLPKPSYARLDNVLIALPPVSFVIIFGTQMDLINAWLCCFRQRRAGSKEPAAASRVQVRVDTIVAMDLDLTSSGGYGNKYQSVDRGSPVSV